ncbi:hypothetical protein Tco_1558936 [Tanacetum coccineum]
MVVTMERWCRGDGVDVVVRVVVKMMMTTVLWWWRGDDDEPVGDDGCCGDDVGGDEPAVMPAVEGWSEVSPKNKLRRKIDEMREKMYKCV